MMRGIPHILALAILAPVWGCLSPRNRPPSELAAIRQPTLWDHLLSDREEEREAIAARLKAQQGSLLGRKAGLMRALRENELEAQLSANDTERAMHQEIVAELTSESGATEHDLEWVAAKQNQNSHDWRYWPNRAAYAKPTAPARAPLVEAPVRDDFHQSSNR
jgi:hypothetical protein